MFSGRTHPLSAFTQHGTLLLELTRREIQGRYRGASIGMLWSLITPFLMLLVYTLAFGYIMRSRWPGAENSTMDFALILFVGLSVHGFFAECFGRAPSLIQGNVNYVKRVVFPLDLLGWTLMLSALFHFTTNLIVLLILKLFVHGSIPVTAFYFPLVIAPFVLFVVGVTWFVAGIGAYLKDVNQFVGVIAAAMLFLSSAIIPTESVPEAFRFVFELNPLTPIINQSREVLLWGHAPDWLVLGRYTLGSLAMFLLGFAFFQRVRGGFADVV